MKNKIISRAIAAISALLILGGCASQTPSIKLDPKNPVALKMWHYYNGPQKQALDNMITEFNESVGSEQGIFIEAFSHGNIGELTEKIVDAAHKKVGSEEIPDIFAAYADTADQIDKIGIVADLAQYFSKNELAEYVPGYISEGTLGSEDGLKIFPIAKSTEIMILNKTDWDEFEAATGAKLGDLATMQGLVGVAKSYYEWTDSQTPASNDGKSFWGRDAMANYFLIGLKQLGVEIFSVDDGKVSFNTDKAAIRTLWDNYYVPSVNGWFGSYGRFRSDDAKTGDIISLVGSTSGAAYFPDSVKTSDTESYPIENITLMAPVFDGGEKVAVQQGAGLVVSKSTPEKEYAASVFLKWFTDVERNIQFSVGSGYLPVKIAANDMDKITEITKTMQDNDNVAKLSTSLPISIQTVAECTLYTSSAFENGTIARSVLENSLTNYVKSDLEKVHAAVATGKSRADSANELCTDENFDSWYNSFCTELANSIK